MAILSNTEFGILRLTISRAQKRNSINAEMFDTMTEALSRAASDDAVRVVLLQGGEHSSGFFPNNVQPLLIVRQVRGRFCKGDLPRLSAHMIIKNISADGEQQGNA